MVVSLHFPEGFFCPLQFDMKGLHISFGKENFQIHGSPEYFIPLKALALVFHFLCSILPLFLKVASNVVSSSARMYNLHIDILEVVSKWLVLFQCTLNETIISDLVYT